MSLLQFNIEKHCYNAGKIDDFGDQVYSNEKVTIIPPYSVFRVNVKTDELIELDLAQDNRYANFS